MPIQIQGAGGTAAEVGAFAAKAVHTVSKPDPHSTLGHYVLAVQTGAMAAGLAGDSEIFQFRWAGSPNLALIRFVSLTGWRTTTAFAAGVANFRLTKAQSWTVNGTGGVQPTLTGDNIQMRVNDMAASQVIAGGGDLRVATTAALTAGTKTLDTPDIGQITASTSAGYGAATPIIGAQLLPVNDMFKADTAAGEHPMILAQNEGFAIRATVPATGVWNLGFLVKWAEVTAY